MNAKTAFVLLSAMGIAALGGCSGSKSESVGETRATLHRAQSCPNLLALLQADARAKVNEYFDRQIESIRRYQQVGVDYAGGSGAPKSAGEANSTGAQPPQDSGGSRASSFSETNVQVKGVDEADIVKTDGKSIFLLHGRSFLVLNAWPANTLSTASSTAIEGQPIEMFVDNGRVVIYSNVDGRPIYDAAGVKYRNEYSDSWYATGGGVARTDVGAPADGSGAYPGYIPQPLTKITVLQLNGTTATVARELYFEGRYLSSRRVGNHVRTVLQGGAHGPNIKTYFEYKSGQQYPTTPEGWIAAYEQLRAENLQAIAATQVSDWIPYQFAKNGGSVQASSIQCEDYYVPTAGSTQYGMTQVQSIDLGNAAAMPRGTAIVGSVDTVYANANTMYLASRAWNQEPIFEPMVGEATASSGTVGSGSTGGGDVAPPPTGTGTRSISLWDRKTPTTLDYTHVHKLEFATDPTFPNYVASGTVPGQIGNQFNMDESDGALRIATTESRLLPDEQNPRNTWGRRQTVNHVFALNQDADWLRKVGDAGEIALGERIFSTRFVGKRAYVVTFRQTDPLFVVDMADAKRPRVLGELTIPGFSTYMHPIDENTLLTIGRDSGALQLQIFDVSDPIRPQQKFKFSYNGQQQYGYSEAEQNHKAFTYFADRQLLAIPFYGYSATGMVSTLEVFKVDPNAGFTKLGSVDHSDFFTQDTRQGYCGGYYSPMVRRGIFMENFVYSISYGGVKAHDVGALTAAGSKLALPTPAVPSYYNGGQPMPACAAE
jgi:uncharacterized secreted protein with C-terminal beta-propeller domain